VSAKTFIRLVFVVKRHRGVALASTLCREGFTVGVCKGLTGQSQPAARALWAGAGHAQHRQRYDNDPSAGSPTETLLRLLLPLNDQV
jgi:hypothetical protein